MMKKNNWERTKVLDFLSGTQVLNFKKWLLKKKECFLSI
jgi:hypothetical protein